MAIDPPHAHARACLAVPGKPNPPPIKLLLTLFSAENVEGRSKHVWEFTDPSDGRAIRCSWGPALAPLSRAVVRRPAFCNPPKRI